MKFSLKNKLFDSNQTCIQKVKPSKHCYFFVFLDIEMIFFSENLGDVTRCILSTVVIGYLIQAWFKSRGAVIRVFTAMLYNKNYL